MWIDSHCHLNHERTADGDTPEAIVARAKFGGVDGMLSICCEIEREFPSLLKTVKALDNVWCSIGTHPHDASIPAEKAVALEKLIDLANSDDKIIGIGESGLDFFYNHSTPEDQEESFRKHIRACIATNLPLIVHARDADADIMRVIRDENERAGARVRGVMHCFSSGPGLAENALAEGFYISFSGIVTFKKSTELQAIAKTVPLDRLLVETDAPFLAPEPYRGKTNEPNYVKYTGEFIAGALNRDPAEIARITKENFFNLFTRAKATWTAN
ncbi:MAG TPA: TatD family hydrolase [Micavibrio sp.]|nr:TatD family hydrolase [Micavibrio sp.]